MKQNDMIAEYQKEIKEAREKFNTGLIDEEGYNTDIHEARWKYARRDLKRQGGKV